MVVQKLLGGTSNLNSQRRLLQAAVSAMSRILEQQKRSKAELLERGSELPGMRCKHLIATFTKTQPGP